MGITAVLVAGCVASHDADPPPDVIPPAGELPGGIWEPAPGPGVWAARVAASDGTLWWAYTRRTAPGTQDVADAVWLAATTASGDSVVAASAVDPTSDAKYHPDVAITPSAVIVSMRGQATALRRYSHAGVPLGPLADVVIEDDGRVVTNVTHTELVATPDGGLRLAAALAYETAELAVVELDASGTATATTMVGAPDTTEPGGSAVYSVGAATRSDGASILAWDRFYNGCISTRPAMTLATTLDGANIGAIETVRDLPEHAEVKPAVAASGTTAYVAFETHGIGSRIALAKSPDVATVLAEFGDANDGNRDVSIALAAPDRGAIAWKADQTRRLNVVGFAERDATVYVSASRVLLPVTPDAAITPVGLVHVGGDRYVLGWIESTGDEQDRLYATAIDLANEALRPAPPLEPLRAPARTSLRRLPCP